MGLQPLITLLGSPTRRQRCCLSPGALVPPRADVLGDVLRLSEQHSMPFRAQASPYTESMGPMMGRRHQRRSVLRRRSSSTLPRKAGGAPLTPRSASPLTRSSPTATATPRTAMRVCSRPMMRELMVHTGCPSLPPMGGERRSSAIPNAPHLCIAPEVACSAV